MLFDVNAIEKLLKIEDPNFDLSDHNDSWENVNNKLSILSYDVPSIKKYIFSSNDFKSILGASRALDKFDSTANKILQKQQAHVIITAGGTGLAICNPSSKEIIEEKVRTSFQEKVPGANLVVSFVDLPVKEILFGLHDNGGKFGPSSMINELNTGSFAELFQFLSLPLKMKRNELLEEYKLILPEVQRCDYCNQEPATRILERYDTKSKICENCYLKHKIGNEKDQSDISKMASGIDDIDTETDPDEKSSWYGAIYIDGNNLGQLYSTIKDEFDYKEKSKQIDNVVKNALKKIVEEFKLQGKYMIPILGGDDLLLFLPMSLTFQVFKSLSKEIEEGFGKMNIGFCSSIAIIPKKLPIKFVFEISDKLLKSSKKEAYKENPKNPGNYVAFRLLYSNNLNPVTENVYFSNLENDVTEFKAFTSEVLGKGIKLNKFISMLDELGKNNTEYSQMMQKILKCIGEHPLVAKLNTGYFLKRSKYFDRLDKTPLEFISEFELLTSSDNKIFETNIRTILDILKVITLSKRNHKNEVKR